MSRLPAACPILAALAVLIGGCGDDSGTPTNESGDESRDYFELSLTISRDVNSRIGELKTTYPDNYIDVANKASFDLQQTRDAYRDYVDLYTEFLDRTGALDPPEALKQLHEENLAANRNVNAINQARLQELLRAHSLANVEAVFESDDAFVAAVEAADEVCNEFRDIAIASGVDWDQPCQLD